MGSLTLKQGYTAGTNARGFGMQHLETSRLRVRDAVVSLAGKRAVTLFLAISVVQSPN